MGKYFRDTNGQIVEAVKIVEFIEEPNARFVILEDGRKVTRPRTHGGIPSTGDYHVKPYIPTTLSQVENTVFVEDAPTYIVARKSFDLLYLEVPEPQDQPSV